MEQEPPTRWGAVLLVVGAGIVVACQIGKAAIALPLLTRDLDVTLTAASWVASIFGIFGVLFGVWAGALVSRFDLKAVVVTSLGAIALGNVLGALAPNLPLLVASRAVEGCGFIPLVIAGPTLMTRLAAGRDRDIAMSVWSSYMGAGSALMMLVAPALISFGWRGLWLANGLLALGYAGAVWAWLPKRDAARPRPASVSIADVLAVVRARGPLLLTISFGLYTTQYMALQVLLPTLLVDRLGLTVAAAGVLSAVVVTGNAIGNGIAGYLLKRGLTIWVAIAGGFLVVGLVPFLIFGQGLPVWVVAVMACVELTVCGILPACILIAVPRLAPAPKLIPVTFGLIQQASNLGQLIGPVLLAAWVEHAGWSAAPAFFVVVALIGLGVSSQVRRMLVRDA
jgi:predicted MFS family arabinose efflux permease